MRGQPSDEAVSDRHRHSAVGVFVWTGYLRSGAVGKATKGRTSATRNLVLVGSRGAMLLLMLLAPGPAGHWIVPIGFGAVLFVFMVLFVPDLLRQLGDARTRQSAKGASELGSSPRVELD